ncbi:radical SAM protein [Anaeroarcus burkinensis]|uniref:radical SAM protein n=1 Tax=Anaeroarcus burkinensis TaxID=82376 RepID=UPI00041331D7|nr:radical SAM protein [Anaeroarcus burkinensis]
MEETAWEAGKQQIQTSLAGAMALGLERGGFYRGGAPGSLNLLLHYEDGCRANCGYCGLARNRRIDEESRTFIRVRWPLYSVKRILEKLQLQGKTADFRHRHLKGLQRICVSMVTHPRAAADTLQLVKELHGSSDLPCSVLLTPTTLPAGKNYLQQLHDAGVDCVGVAVDAATPEIFERWRGAGVAGPHRWQRYWDMLQDATEVFADGLVSVHLIVGLGETEEEMVRTMRQVRRTGAQIHLFSFCPEDGSGMEAMQPPPLGQYRRMQVAAYLANRDKLPWDKLTYSPCGQVTFFGAALQELLGEDWAQGVPFMTGGCPGSDGCTTACNRPYGNEKPGQVLHNYPFKPQGEDLASMEAQIWHE